jgi:hypothetical protein
VRQSYPTKLRFAKPTAGQLQTCIEELCRRKVSELFQAVLEIEVDDALERVRYERRTDPAKAGYRDGHDRPRSIASNRAHE